MDAFDVLLIRANIQGILSLGGAVDFDIGEAWSPVQWERLGGVTFWPGSVAWDVGLPCECHYCKVRGNSPRILKSVLGENRYFLHI